VKRFGIYDSGPEHGDRYTVIDRVPQEPGGYYEYLGMSAYPFHPQGIGQHGELSASQYRQHQLSKFRGLGKPIALEALPEQARKAAEQFIRACSEAA